MVGAAVPVGVGVRVLVSVAMSVWVGALAGVLVSTGAAVSLGVVAGLGVGVWSMPSSALKSWKRSRRVRNKAETGRMARFMVGYFTPS